MIMITEGGTNEPSVPPAAIHPVAKEGAYFRLSISGKATLPKVAAVAGDDPQMAPKKPHPPMVDRANPPRRCPKNVYARL